MLAGLVTGVVIGFGTGWLRAKVGIPSFVITLATFLAFQGITVILVGGSGSIPVNSHIIVALEGLNGHFLSAWAAWAILAVTVLGYAAVKLQRRVRSPSRRPAWPCRPS